MEMIEIVVTALLGSAGGVLINYLSDVLPTQRKLSLPACPACKAPLRSSRALLGYILWSRDCPECGKFYGWRRWLVCIAALGAALWLWSRLPNSLDFGLAWVLLVYFGVVTVIDLEHRLILHMSSLAGVMIGVVIGSYLHGWQSTLLGGLSGFGIMLGIYILGIIMVRVLARWRNAGIDAGEAMGFGDVTLSGVIGLLLGWPGIVGGLLLTIILAGAASLTFTIVMWTLRRYHPGMALPHGPFLIASAAILLFLL
jgi:leader peptidase (prepilin peptidase)/N-methyltransferase